MTYRAELVRDADRAACNASPGPWKTNGTSIVDAGGRPVGIVESYADALATVAAFNLVAEVARDQALKDELERGAEALKEKVAMTTKLLSELHAEKERLEGKIERAKARLAELTRKVDDAVQSAGGATT